MQMNVFDSNNLLDFSAVWNFEFLSYVFCDL